MTDGFVRRVASHTMRLMADHLNGDLTPFFEGAGLLAQDDKHVYQIANVPVDVCVHGWRVWWQSDFGWAIDGCLRSYEPFQYTSQETL